MPYGVSEGRVVARTDRGVIAVGDVIKDGVFERDSLNAFMAQGPAAWHETNAAVARAVETPTISRVALTMPFAVADYVDFYSSIHHATNLGRLFRPDAEPLLANWRHLPVGYHGRAGSVALSGTPVVRPTGLVATADGVVRKPSAQLDIELEVGFVVGVGSTGAPIAVDDADQHVFGVVLVNDWSARDIQAFEYQPLGPMLGKSFLTSISPWVVTLHELTPFLRPSPEQDPWPDPQLRGTRDWALDLDLEVELNGEVISRVNFADMYWTFAQQLAHLTSNGARARTGDLLASGTVSGATPDSYGSLIELYRRERFLADGDTVVFARAQRRRSGTPGRCRWHGRAGDPLVRETFMFYRRVGSVPRKRHTVHCDEHGNRLIEELVGEEGFAAASSLLYHRHSPSALERDRSARGHSRRAASNHTRRPPSLPDLRSGGRRRTCHRSATTRGQRRPSDSGDRRHRVEWAVPRRGRRPTRVRAKRRRRPRVELRQAHRARR